MLSLISCVSCADGAASRPDQPEVYGFHRFWRCCPYPFLVQRAGYSRTERSAGSLTPSNPFLKVCLGLTCSDRLFISDRAHLVLGFHQIVDGLKEIELGGSSIGTTKKGIGPAYSSKASRSGLRVHHLYDSSFPAKFRKLVDGRFKRYGHFEFDTEGEIEMYLVSYDSVRLASPGRSHRRGVGVFCN